MKKYVRKNEKAVVTATKYKDGIRIRAVAVTNNDIRSCAELWVGDRGGVYFYKEKYKNYEWKLCVGTDHEKPQTFYERNLAKEIAAVEQYVTTPAEDGGIKEEEWKDS